MFSGQHRNTVSREAGIQHDGRDLHLLAACQGVDSVVLHFLRGHHDGRSIPPMVFELYAL